MQIIKDKAIINDHWTYLNDDDPLPVNGDITVSLTRWQRDKTKLLDHSGNIGLRIKSTDNLEDITDDLNHFSLIELDFAAFTDGRSFSQAWLLRNRYHFNSELRAVGNFMVDQMFYLQRTGVNSFSINSPERLKTGLNTLNDFSVHYQSSTN